MIEDGGQMIEDIFSHWRQINLGKWPTVDKWVQLTRMSRDKVLNEVLAMEEIKDLKDKADEYFNRNDFVNAHGSYELLAERLLSHINDTRTIRRLAKGGGWVVALLTGGFGMEDVVIVPAVNRLLLKLLNIDIDKLLEILGYALRQKLGCLVMANGLAKKVDYTLQLKYFIVVYMISARASETKSDKFAKILDLINPLSDTIDLEKIDRIESENEIYDLLLELIEKQLPQVERLNSYLFAFLNKVDQKNKPLFVRLQTKGYTT